MPEERPVKALLNGQLAEGSRKFSRPFLKFKDTLKDILKRGAVLFSWRNIVADRPGWRRLETEVCNKIDDDRRKRGPSAMNGEVRGNELLWTNN